VICSLRPTNTGPAHLSGHWLCGGDLYGDQLQPGADFLPHGLPAWARRILTALLGVALLFGLSWGVFFTLQPLVWAGIHYIRFWEATIRLSGPT
jgi:hypothetical protein